MRMSMNVIPSQFQLLKLHGGLVLLCILYIVVGATVFYQIEKPEEIQRRNKALKQINGYKEKLLKAAIEFVESENDFEIFAAKIVKALDTYESSMFEIFKCPVAMTIFAPKEMPELWTVSSSILFTATTMIPIGFGIVTPVTKLGRIVLICFAATGIPLAVTTLGDLGKFICGFLCTQIKDQSLLPPAIVFTSFFIYPTVGGLLICFITTLGFFDSLYYCIMTILMIGYGDFSPAIPLIILLSFIVMGVVLVTVAIDAAGADIINHIHFMGRQVGKAKVIAEKMYLIAQKMSMNKGIETGVAQLNALARYTATMGLKPNRVTRLSRRKSSIKTKDGLALRKGPYEPSIELAFVDRTPRSSSVIPF